MSSILNAIKIDISCGLETNNFYEFSITLELYVVSISKLAI